MASEKLIIEISETGARVVQRSILGIGLASQQAAVQQQGLNAAMRGTAVTAGFLRQSLTLLGIGSLAIGVRGAVSSLAAFEQRMAAVKAVSEATDEEFASFRETALELGRSTRFSAVEAAEGMEVLARAGFTANQTLSATADVLRLAQVGGLDLANAADIAAATLAGFRLDVSESGRVTDVLAKAANESKTSVEGIGFAMKFAAPAAAGLGISLEETAAAMGVLSNAGLEASLAGTGLRRVLSELESPQKKTVRLLAELGVQAAEVRPSQVGLTAALERLKEAGTDVGVALEIFGDRGGPAFEVLAAGLPKVKELTEVLNNAQGSAAKTAAVMDDNLGAAFKRVVTSAQAAVISLGDVGGTAAIRSALEGIAEAFRIISRNAGVAAAAIAGFFLGGPVIAVLTAALVAFSDQIALTSDGVVTLRTVLLEMLKTAAFGFDKLVGGLTGGIAAVLVTFQQIPAALVDLFVQGLNKVIGVINAFLRKVQLVINSTLTEINAISAQAGEAFGFGSAGLDIKPVVLGQIDEVGNVMAGEMEALGAKASEAFAAGFTKQPGAEKAIQRLIDAAAGGRRPAGAAAGGGVGPLAAGAGVDAGLEDETTRGRQAAGIFSQLNREIEDEARLLRLSAREREVGARILDIENNLKSRGIDVTTQENTKLLEGVEARIRMLEAEKLRAQVLDEIRGPSIELLETQTVLNQLLMEGAITAEEHAEAMRKLAAETQRGTSAFDGFVDAIERVDVSARALGENLAGALLGSIDRASDALADFAISGFQDVESLKQAFSDLFADLAKQILKIIIQTLILKAIQAAIPGGGGVGSAIGAAVGSAGTEAALTQRQAGGPVTRGRPVVVGERGRELFTPPSSGSIVPNSQIGAPQVNVSVVNVKDPDEVTSVINSAEGERVIMNVLSKNKQTLKALVS